VRKIRDPGKRPRRSSLEDEIAQLRDLDLEGLRVHWRNVFAKPGVSNTDQVKGSHPAMMRVARDPWRSRCNAAVTTSTLR
jgi:hypothetical protein